MGWDGKKKVSERRPERKGKCGAQDKLEMQRDPPRWWRDESQELEGEWSMCATVFERWTVCE